MAITKIQSESLNLADTYDFTGTVTGAGGGITQADMWRYTGNASTSNTRTVISADLERADDASSGLIGSGMTQSSGIFTFPETGIYSVDFQATYYKAGDTRSAIAIIEVTTDNSTYDIVSMARSHVTIGYGNTYISMRASALVDVTNTSNVKVRFKHQSDAAAALFGTTDENSIFFKFIRLGDT
jgi:hypothetical protein